MKTTYRIIKEFPSYRVGSDGSLWSKHVFVPGVGSMRKGKWKRLVGRVNRQGYLYFTACKSGFRKSLTLHRQILIAFCGEPQKGEEACHNNGNRLDNRIENLRWDSRKGNSADRLKHGTMLTGNRNPSAKLDEAKVREIRRLRLAGKTNKMIALEFGVSWHTISAIARKVIWTDV